MRRVPVVCGLLIALWAMHGVPMSMAGTMTAVMSATTSAATNRSPLGSRSEPIAAAVDRTRLGARSLGSCDAAHDHCAVTLRGTPDLAAAASAPAVDDAGAAPARCTAGRTASSRAPPDPGLRERLCVSRT